MTATTKFRVIGISDDTTCECCGKENLKRTVVLATLDAEGGEMGCVKFGRDCAARALRIRCTANRMESIAVAEQRKRDDAELARVHLVGETRSVRPWVVESIGGNGGTITFLALADGLRPAVERWAQERWPNTELTVRVAR